MFHRRTARTAVLVLPLVLWACGEAADEGATETEMAPETAGEPTLEEPAEAGIAGRTLTTTVVAEEAPADAPEAAGTWTITLAEDGTFEVRQSGSEDAMVQGTYTIEGDRITWNDAGGPAGCEEPIGTYEFSVSGDQVTFTSVDDECPGRLTVLTVHPLAME